MHQNWTKLLAKALQNTIKPVRVTFRRLLLERQIKTERRSLKNKLILRHDDELMSRWETRLARGQLFTPTKKS